MAAGIRNYLLGVTQEQFDALNKQLDMASDPPPGLLFHRSRRLGRQDPGETPPPAERSDRRAATLPPGGSG